MAKARKKTVKRSSGKRASGGGGGGAFVFIAIALVVVIVVGVKIASSGSDNTRHQQVVLTDEEKQAAKPVVKPIVEKPVEKPVVEKPKVEKPKKPEKTKAELLFEQYYKEEAAGLPKAPLNVRTEIETWDLYGKKRVYMGKVVKTTDTRVFIEDAMEPGKTYKLKRVDYPFNILTTKSMKKFFPDRTARLKAQARVDIALEEELAAAESKRVAARSKTTASGGGASPGAYLSKFDRYDTTSVTTPRYMSLAVEEVSDWAAAQVRRGGIRIFENVFAKRQGPATVLYVQMTKDFYNSDFDTKLQLADGMRQFWALRCQSNGIASSSKAYICIFAKKPYITSNMKDASVIKMPRS